MNRILIILLALGLGLWATSGCSSGTSSQDDTAVGSDAEAAAEAGETAPDVDQELPDKDVKNEGGGEEFVDPSDRCDDGDPCTFGDHKVDGGCVGTAYTCDDGKACTDEACDGVGGCQVGVLEGWCLIDGTCVSSGASPDGQGCVVCDPSRDRTAWSPGLGEGTPCDDGSACTFYDSCRSGLCAGDALVCDDGNVCTTDWCDPASGCVNAPNALECEDADVCTLGDICVEGQCAPGDAHLACDDGNPCTADLCLPEEGCVFSVTADPCDDGDECTLGDVCVDKACMPGEGKPSCDDANDCTIDSCDPFVGCLHLLDLENACCASGVNPCDDHNPCTADVCNPSDQSCMHLDQPDYTPCDDHDPCTVNDVCYSLDCDSEDCDAVPSWCQGTYACDDGNSCTVDSCDPLTGCKHAAAEDGAACDDGDACTDTDVCSAGKCAGDTHGCTLCPPAFWNPAGVVVALSIGTDGQPGSGLDVDDDPGTCQPTGKCSAGIDNQLASLAGLANPSIEDALAGGSISLLFEHAALVQEGVPYTLNFYAGDPVDEACDPNSAVCGYLVEPAGLLQPQCTSMLSFANAQVVGGTLTAGDPDSVIGMSFPLAAGLVLQLHIFRARVQAQVTLTEGVVSAMEGVLAGAIRQDEVVAAITAVPEDQFPPQLPKDTVLSLVPVLFKSDIDTDGDGLADASSIGLKLRTVPATLAGVKP
jgi:hypothetical protein